MRYLILVLVACMAHLCANEEKVVGREMGVLLPIGDFEFTGRILSSSNWEGEIYTLPSNYTRSFFFFHKSFNEDVNPEEFIEVINQEAQIIGANVNEQTLFYSGKTGQIPMISQILEFEHVKVGQLYIFNGNSIVLLSATVCKCDLEGIDFWREELKEVPAQIEVCPLF